MSPALATLKIRPTGKAAPVALDHLQQMTREDLLRLEARITADAVEAAVDLDAAPVPLRYGDRLIQAQPLDTRRFVRAMARYMSLN